MKTAKNFGEKHKNKEIRNLFEKKGICEELFVRPQISEKKCNKKNVFGFIFLHLIIYSISFVCIICLFNSNFFFKVYLFSFILVFGVYFYLTFSNPGINIGEKIFDFNFLENRNENVNDYCPYCKIKKKDKTKHCLICKKCINDFDHHCFWVGNCIGKKNLSLFYAFLFSTICIIGYFAAALTMYASKS